LYKDNPRVRIAVFASGTGTNARKLIEHFNEGPGRGVAEICLIACNNPGAGVLNLATEKKIDRLLVEKESFFRGGAYLDELKDKQIDLIVLAGFLWKIPEPLLDAYPRAIINIHPALLPRFGGKGMYGHRVHEAVIEAGVAESGITIHYVDGHYDNGDIIFQAHTPVSPADTPDSLAKKVRELEHQHFPAVVEQVALNLIQEN
jgi:phosphoribosylglycinamide formyltransferase-1